MVCQRPLCSPSSAYTLVLGITFVSLGTGRILLFKFAANAENKYDFLPASVNMLAEALKLLFCLVMSVRVFIREGRSCKDLGCSSASSLLSSLKWAVPAFLYFLDNLIIFYVMTYLQPVMAVLFSNFVILTTAVLFRVVLKRQLSWVQWAVLLILFLSIVSLSLESESQKSEGLVWGGRPRPLSAPSNSCLLYTQLLEEMKNSSGSPLPTTASPGWGWLGAGHALLLLQCFISSMANIYNEKILKEGQQLSESIFIQNSKLYAFGVAFNGLTLLSRRESRGLVVHCGLFYGHNVYSLALVLVTACLGLSVAFILKFRDNMFHVLTNQITSVLVIGLSLFLWDFRPSPDFFLKAPVVPLAIFIYNASRPRDRLFPPRLANGEPLMRSRGDGEELELLTKAHQDSDSEESL
ncbi:UDP-sugar transporter protein SLC35A5 [Stigmatopora nigra]